MHALVMHRQILCACSALLLLWCAACAATQSAVDLGGWPGLEALLCEEPADPQARSLDGQVLAFSAPTGEALERQERLLEEARKQLYRAPTQADSWIWVGRRLAYLGRYRAAQRVYTQGLVLNPNSYRLLRHRGHRWLTLRQFALAEVDLAQAERLSRNEPDRIEPDGLPNAAGVPTGTDRTSITYHLALAHYLQGDFESAAHWWQSCHDVADNPDMWSAASYWLYHAKLRSGDATGAAQVLASVDAGWELLENHVYHRLLLHYRGDLDRETVLEGGGADTIASPTTLYGLAIHDLEQGRRDLALRGFQSTRSAGSWAAFGAIAAEVECAHLPAARR